MNNNINPDDIIKRTLLMMKYDSTKTLDENVESINTPIVESKEVISELAVPTIATITTWAQFGLYIGGATAIIGGLSYWIYAVNRTANNEEKLRNAVKACKVTVNKGKRSYLQSEGLLKDSQRNQAALNYFQGVKNQDLDSGMFNLSFGQGLGTDEEKIRKANRLIKNGNMADLCLVMFKYQQLTGGLDFANDMAGDLSEGELAEIIAVMQNMLDPYAGGGFKVIPEDSYNIAWYKERFGCVFQTQDTWVKGLGVKKNPDGYTYIVIKGRERIKPTGSKYNILYRLYGVDGRLDIADPTNPRPTNAKLTCNGSKPVAVISGSVNENSILDTFNKHLLKEVFDDSKVKSMDVKSVEDELIGWEDGKKDVPWSSWLKKYPCLKLKFPSTVGVTPKKDGSGYTYFINLNPKNKTKYRFYSDGEIWTEDGSKFIGKHWSCPSRGDSILVESHTDLEEQIPFDVDGGSEKETSPSTGGGSLKPKVKKSKYKDCPDFPFTKGCKNSKIGEIQTILNITSDNKFGPKTLEALGKIGKGPTITKTDYDELKNKKVSTPSQITTPGSETLEPEIDNKEV